MLSNMLYELLEPYVFDQCVDQEDSEKNQRGIGTNKNAVNFRTISRNILRSNVSYK